MSDTIKLALAKGRVLKEAIVFLKCLGIEIDLESSGRKLVLDTNIDSLKVILVRSVDVPVFVQHGSVDIGFVGKDVLLEHSNVGLYELLDLKIAVCKLCVAAKSSNDMKYIPLKVASKYVNVTKSFFNKHPIEVIKLYGGMELAPIVGISNCIVDLVDTGNTLKSNGLKVINTISPISTRLIANVSSYHTKYDGMNFWFNKMQEAL